MKRWYMRGNDFTLQLANFSHLRNVHRKICDGMYRVSENHRFDFMHKSTTLLNWKNNNKNADEVHAWKVA